MPPLLGPLTSDALTVGLPGWLKWILARVHISLTDMPLGPVILDLRAKRYLNLELRIGRGYTVTVDLRD